ncbi:MAG: HEAT repeat domain-containing protein, partial [Gemmatales bacterium]|nr:HEAT repeat domain-containing protein [Gemmatales bacterium]
MREKMTAVMDQHGWVIGLVLVLLEVTSALRSGDRQAAFRLPKGFVMELFADEMLANDIYAMTLDEQGHVIVTSAGYIKRLQDINGDGRADQATVLATPRSGGMGLFCDGEYVYYCGDGWLSRYRRVDESGRLADEPEKIIPLAFGEHGGHAVRKGPDGCWYVIAGNDARVTAELINDPNSPIRRPEAGCLLRLRPPPAGKGPWQVQVVAHGFRNPYDFDFGPAGEMFTYDSDVERTFLLPWYVPTRIYHIAWSAHHGWRLPGYLRSWARCDDYLDNVEMLWAIGRGSPTGVVVYRHRQFPQKYHEGLFVADWTFGRIYFVPLIPEGATFRGQAEVFLEPTGLEGFAPTDLAVGKDGELFVCIGGRRTRGAVYRIRYLGPAPCEPQDTTDLDRVLRAPQPLEAWSRARWQPLARQLGKAAFLNAARDGQRAVAERVRAVEILTELFDGLDYETAHALAQDRSEQVRSATAWSSGCLEPTKPSSGNSDTLGESKLSRAAYATLINLARDEHPRVRCRALEALRQHKSAFPERQLVEVIVSALDNRDKRVRQSAARLASQLSEPAWRELWEKRQNYPANARLTLCLAYCWREPAAACLAEVVMEALSILESNTLSEATRFDAVRMIMLACGDWELDKPPVEILTGYTLRHAPPEALRKRLTQALHRHWPGETPRWNQEAARLLAMLRDDSPDLPRKLASFWKADSDPTWDVHYLIVLACARASWPDQLAEQVAHVLVQLHERLEGKHLRVKLTWGDRLAELVHLLVQRDSRLAQQLARHPVLVQPSHVVLALALPDTERAVA